MRIRYSVLLSLATLGCLAQEQNLAPQETQPEKPPKPDYFLQPQFRPLRPFVAQGGLAPQEAPPPKSRFDFKFPLFRSLRRPLSQNRITRPTLKVIPDGKNFLTENPSPCSIPLLQAQIPKDIQFTIKQFHPRPDQLGPIATVKAPAPACNDRR